MFGFHITPSLYQEFEAVKTIKALTGRQRVLLQRIGGDSGFLRLLGPNGQQLAKSLCHAMCRASE